MTRTYLDHASTSTLRPSALAAMSAHLEEMAAGHAGDPARIHVEGMASRGILEDARARVAAWLGVRPRQVVFTSGATESVAAAHQGALLRGAGEGRHAVVLSAVEHSSVTGNARGGPHHTVPVDRGGRTDPSDIVAAVGADTALVHLQWTNHELGVDQPVAEVVEALADHPVLVHTDAAQAGTSVPEAVASGADLVSVSGHKLGAPAGIGLLVIRRNLRIAPLLPGGDQERARRGGMENVAAALGLAAVADELVAGASAESARMRRLSERVLAWADRTDGVSVLGDRRHRCDHLVCLQLEGIEPQPVLLELDRRGIAVHSGSSCSSEAFEPSPVLSAMGVEAQRSLRISVGWSTTDAEVDEAITALGVTLDELGRLGAPT